MIASGALRNRFHEYTWLRKKLLWTTAAVGIMCLSAVIGILWWRSPLRGMPYHDSFAAEQAGEWTAIGGSWSVRNGVMRNDSDERGSKLLSGSEYWKDYRIEADVRLLGHIGDIGLILRSNDEERGVDAYNGYYVGLRSGDGSLVIGRADHGWMEALPIAFPGGILQNHWYRLRAAIVGCRIAASATDLVSGLSRQVLFEDLPCVPAGRIGLRSLSTGGEWRNIAVSSATEADLHLLAAGVTQVLHPDIPKSEAIYNSVHTFPQYDPVKIHEGKNAPADETKPIIQQIGNLSRGYDKSTPKSVVIRGVVVLTFPTLYVQDATGGVAVEDSDNSSLSLGDEVEITGTPEPRDYSVSIRNASIRLLWDRVPMPPVAVTPAQAATGTFDAVLVETQGYLVSEEPGLDETLILQMESGAQRFQVLALQGRGDQVLRNLTPHSLLRLRGICVLDKRYTHQKTPFALLLRSTDDIDILAGPPWWTARHLIEIAFALLLLILCLQFVYNRVERWRLRSIMQERERLAHDMHDTLAQSFAGVAFQLQGIRHGLRHHSQVDLSKLNQQLDLACDIVRQTHEEASLTIAMLRPDSREVGDLAFALDRCAQQIVAGGNIAIEMLCEGNVRQLPLAVTEALFHIGREAVVNVVRHAHASRITLRVIYQPNRIELSVEDDGSGFDPSIESSRLGLRGMAKRAKSIGAELTIDSGPGKGTSVQVATPLVPRRPMMDYLSDKIRQVMSALGWRRVQASLRDNA